MTTDPSQLPLSNHRLYDGTDVDDTREVLSQIFTQIALDPLDPAMPFRAQVNGVELPRIAICYLHFENGAVAGPVQPLDFHTLQLNPTGSVVYGTNDGATGGDSDRGVMLSAGQTVRNRHSAGNGNLALVVKDDTLRNHLTQYTGNDRAAALTFTTGFDLTRPRMAALSAFVDAFTRELNRPGGILESPAAVASFEDFLLTSLLFGMEHSLSDRLTDRDATAGPAYVRRLEEFIAAHATEPINIERLCAVSGLSGAAIHRAFRKYRDYTPMQFLQAQRFRLVRHRLLACSASESVSKIAMECGFVHMGRFAAAYRQRFGENPSETAKRARANGT